MAMDEKTAAYWCKHVSITHNAISAYMHCIVASVREVGELGEL